MAVVLVDGFDTYNGTGANTGLTSKWVESAGISMQTGRFGGQGMRFTPSASNGQTQRVLPAAYGAVGIGCGFKVVTVRTLAVGSVTSNISFRNGTTQHVGISVNPNFAIEAYRLTAPDTGTLLGTSANNVVVLGTYHFLELGVTISDTVGTVTVKIDGVTVLSLTGQDTRNGATSTVDQLFVGPGGYGSNLGVYEIDDLYVVDSATTIGERRVETLYPTSDVAQGFARSTGAVNYSLVDEALANGDTDYVQGSTVGDVDTYGIANLSASPATIDAVQVSVYAKKTDAGSRSIALQLISGATTSDGANFALASAYGKHERLTLLDPNGSIAWTAANVNALTGGPKVTV